MPKHLLGIDHCVILVEDLDEARDIYEQLGFTLSPRGFHSAHMGSANHTIMLQADYFELLGIVSPTDHNTRWREVIKTRGEGLNAIALQTDGAEAAAREIRDLGIAAGDPVRFSRPVELPGGAQGEAAFTVTQFPPESTPLSQMFVCDHHTRDMVWVPELMEHANGAIGLDAIFLSADDPEATAKPYARIFGQDRSSVIDGGIAIDTGNTAIEILKPGSIAARLANIKGLAGDGLVGLRIRVADIETTGDALSLRGVETRPTLHGLVVAPGDACGAAIEFAAA